MRGPRIWFDPPLFSWRRVLITAGLAAVAVFGWLLHERGLWPAEAEPLPQAAAPVASAAASGTVRTAGRSVPVAVTRAVAAAPGVPAPESPAPDKVGPSEIEVCGIGAVKVGRTSSGDVSDPLEQALKRRSAAVRSAWAAALDASADVRVRAAGLRIPAITPSGGGAQSDKLARLALDSRDPMVYALAMSQCQTASSGACQMLSHEQWVTIDPDNASPWLRLAETAAARKADPAEAMHRAARAKYIKSYGGSLQALVMGAQPPATPPLDRMLMAAEATAASVGMPLSAGPTLSFCSPAALRDANRRQSCEALAELFANRADTVSDLTIGRALGERLGWPAERLAALRDERDALSALHAGQIDPSEHYSCAGVERQVVYFAEVARQGELGALREGLRRSGRSVEEWAASAKRDPTEAPKRAASQGPPPDAGAASSPRS